MSNEVDICNLALSHLGDVANISSIDPPENSVQAMHCARFYPIARNALLEMANWSFAMRRIALTPLSVTNNQWQYVYAKPNLMLRAIAVISADADNDYVTPDLAVDNLLDATAGVYTPQPFCLETLSTGALVICTDQEDAVLRYTIQVTDTTLFSPLFVLCLSWLLASMLAGPIMKGDAGRAEGKRCYQMLQALLTQTIPSDANQRSIKPVHSVPWLVGR